MDTPNGPRQLRLTKKGKELIELYRKVGRYSFESFQTLRAFEKGVLEFPTGELVLDNYIKSLLVDGYLAEDEIHKEATKCSK